MAQKESNTAQFQMTGWKASHDAPAVSFFYECSKFGSFTETVSFPLSSGGLAQRLDSGLVNLISMLQIALGVSYYKCAAAKQIVLPAAASNGAIRDFANVLYTDGLAEFFVRAGLSYPPEIFFSVSADAGTCHPGHTKQSTEFSHHALVAFGGGKDSYVASAIINAANIKSRLCSVVMSDKVRHTIQRTSSEPVLFMQRQLDPKLRDVNSIGAYNGHVPITAINSLMLVILGRMTSAEYVVFANERSADEPTMSIGEIVANHQYSKSSFFEDILRHAILAADHAAPEYFSILRPFSEIWIAGRFASLNDAFKLFTSCNRNFSITGKDAPRWCGACAKCAFTSLLLAAYISPKKAAGIFPENFLNSEDLLPLYRELCGLTKTKPWDCVGTINECKAAMYRLSKMKDWQDTLVVRTITQEILRHNSVDELEAFWQEGIEVSQRHFVPDIFMKAANVV